MGVGLDPDIRVVSKAVTVDEVLDGPEGDVGLIRKPGSPEDDEGVEENQKDEESSATSTPGHGTWPVRWHSRVSYGFSSFIDPVVMKMTRSAMLVTRSPMRSRLWAHHIR